MDRMQVPPTRFNLLRLKREHAVLRSGHDLLERKREALLAEMKNEVGGLREQVAASQEKFQKALWSLAVAESGSFPQLSGWGRLTASVSSEQRSVMGVTVSFLKVSSKTTGKVMFSPFGEDVALEELVDSFLEFLTSLSRIAELEGSIAALAREMKTTQRRVNALENVFLPEYEATIRFISDTLEEREREELISLKAIKEGYGG